MSLLKQICFIIIGFVYLPSNKAGTFDENVFVENYKGISADYFFGESSLRSKYVLTCKGDEATLQSCYRFCGHSYFRCIYNKCTCIDDFIKRKRPKIDLKNVLEYIEKFAGVVRSLTSADENDDERSSELLQEDHPALRHHIAHFCPNLEVARTCIRTCMQVGKPAFCGKDHRCYCGHRYGAEDEDKKIDLADVQAQFRDLYEKYFGTTAMDSMKNNQNEKPTSGSSDGKSNIIKI